MFSSWFSGWIVCWWVCECNVCVCGGGLDSCCASVDSQIFYTEVWRNICAKCHKGNITKPKSVSGIYFFVLLKLISPGIITAALLWLSTANYSDWLKCHTCTKRTISHQHGQQFHLFICFVNPFLKANLFMKINHHSTEETNNRQRVQNEVDFLTTADLSVSCHASLTTGHLTGNKSSTLVCSTKLLQRF